MSNWAWVCFDCRAAVRRSATAADVRCPSCARACERLGTKVPIPPRAKIKAWERLRAQFHQFQRARWLTIHKERVRQIHNLEQEIARLGAMPATKRGRVQRLAHLQRRLKSLRAAPI